MKYLLDTNTCIRHINGRSPVITKRLSAIKEGDIVLCAVVVAELLFGAYGSQYPEQTVTKQLRFTALFSSLPFDDVAADHYAQIRTFLKKQGTPIGANDLLIAAIARANNLTLVTHNIREFQRVPNLQLEDWEQDT